MYENILIIGFGHCDDAMTGSHGQTVLTMHGVKRFNGACQGGMLPLNILKCRAPFPAI